MCTQLCGRGMCALREHSTTAARTVVVCGVVGRRAARVAARLDSGTVEARDAQATDGVDRSLGARGRRAPMASGRWGRTRHTHAERLLPEVSSCYEYGEDRSSSSSSSRQQGFQKPRRLRGSFDGRRCAAAAVGQAALWKTAPGRMAAAAAQDHLKRILRKAFRKSRLKMV